MPPRLVPEFLVSDIARSMRFYVDVLGFEVLYERPEEKFAYLDLDGANLMLGQAHPASRLLIGPLEHPYGRGVNLQVQVDNIASMYEGVTTDGAPIALELEENWYRTGDELKGQRQFVVEDPDGYLLRFYQDLGRKSVVP
jgi:catechol 2,3-dioxygenase-like lactoylglutathione lyase family enzyme